MLLSRVEYLKAQGSHFCRQGPRKHVAVSLKVREKQQVAQDEVHRAYEAIEPNVHDLHYMPVNQGRIVHMMSTRLDPSLYCFTLAPSM